MQGATGVAAGHNIDIDVVINPDVKRACLRQARNSINDWEPEIACGVDFWAYPCQVIMDAAKLVNADIVLLDLNPSLSTINRNMLMSSDYIVVTTRPEEYSLENMDTFINKMTRNDLSADMYGGSWLQQMIHNVRREVNFKHANQPPRCDVLSFLAADANE